MTLAVPDGWQVSTFASMAEIPKDGWDSCVGPDEALLRHSHLLALERSGVVAPANGFTPCHVVLHDQTGQIVAAAPAYLKTHGRGELGIDLGFAMAHARSVGPYYPKLQVEVPLIPFRGRRLLFHPQVPEAVAIPALLAALKTVASQRGASSVHIGYMTHHEAQLAGQAGFAGTETSTFVWRPADETSFDGFLARMNQRGRSEIRRQRRRVAEAGLRFRYFRGADLTPEMGAAFFNFYKENFDRHSTQVWLNADYFRQIFETMANWIELSVSYLDDQWVGAVFSFAASDKAYVQYWGQAGEVRFLHFEQVIYRGIERAYVTGLDYLDFGPTGSHKAERGLIAEAIYHATWFVNESFSEVAVAAYGQKTKIAIAERAAEILRLPFVNRLGDLPEHDV